MPIMVISIVSIIFIVCLVFSGIMSSKAEAEAEAKAKAEYYLAVKTYYKSFLSFKEDFGKAIVSYNNAYDIADSASFYELERCIALSEASLNNFINVLVVSDLENNHNIYIKQSYEILMVLSQISELGISKSEGTNWSSVLTNTINAISEHGWGTSLTQGALETWGSFNNAKSIEEAYEMCIQELISSYESYSNIENRLNELILSLLQEE